MVGGRGVQSVTYAGDLNGLFRKSRSGSSAACPWWGGSEGR